MKITVPQAIITWARLINYLGEYLLFTSENWFALSVWHQQNQKALDGSYKHEVCNFSCALANLMIEVTTGIYNYWNEQIIPMECEKYVNAFDETMINLIV